MGRYNNIYSVQNKIYIQFWGFCPMKIIENTSCESPMRFEPDRDVLSNVSSIFNLNLDDGLWEANEILWLGQRFCQADNIRIINLLKKKNSLDLLIELKDEGYKFEYSQELKTPT